MLPVDAGALCRSPSPSDGARGAPVPESGLTTSASRTGAPASGSGRAPLVPTLRLGLGSMVVQGGF